MVSYGYSIGDFLGGLGSGRDPVEDPRGRVTDPLEIQRRADAARRRMDPANDLLEGFLSQFSAGFYGEPPPQPQRPAVPTPGTTEPKTGLNASEAAAALRRGESRRFGVPSLQESLDSPAGRGEGAMALDQPAAPPAPARTPSQVKLMVGGKEYDYSDGKAGGASALADDDGMVRGLRRDSVGVGPRGGLMSGGQAEWNPSAQGGTVSTLDTPFLRQESERANVEQSLPLLGAQAEAAGLRQQAEDPLGLKAAAERARIEGNERLRVEQGKSSIQLAEQERRRSAYVSALSDEEAAYNDATARIVASNLPQEQKEARLQAAAQRFAEARQQVREAFGFGQQMSAGWIGSRDI